MAELDLLYLENIDEFVKDQDKIVTYKWLSLTLGVHINTAKQMLFHYLETQRREGCSSLHATFLLSGRAEEQGRAVHKVCVVREEELEEAKSRLCTVASVHVYSVHKALLRDSAPLFGVDYDAVKNNIHQCNRFSSIHCPDAVPLSNAQPPPPQSPESRPQTQTQTRPAPKPKGIMGIFANKPKTETKIKTEPETRTETKPGLKTEAKPESREEPVNQAPKAKPNPMSHFFGSQTNKKVQKVESSSSTEQRPLQENREQRSKSKRPESDSEEEEEKEEVKKRKRRRIKRPQSDSSDDEATPPQTRTETRSESPLQTRTDTRTESPSQTRTETRTESPEKKGEESAADKPAPEVKEEESMVPDTPPQRIRRRRRVLKSNTFLDDEGCIVTEKVYESESFSEDEEPQTKPGPSLGLKPGPGPKAAPPRAAEEKKKKKGGGGAKVTKQASIMGFFNKK